jgi:hypothetical protein
MRGYCARLSAAIEKAGGFERLAVGEAIRPVVLFWGGWGKAAFSIRHAISLRASK